MLHMLKIIPITQTWGYGDLCSPLEGLLNFQRRNKHHAKTAWPESAGVLLAVTYNPAQHIIPILDPSWWMEFQIPDSTGYLHMPATQNFLAFYLNFWLRLYDHRTYRGFQICSFTGANAAWTAACAVRGGA